MSFSHPRFNPPPELVNQYEANIAAEKLQKARRQVNSGIAESEKLKEKIMGLVAKLEQTARDYDEKLVDIKLAEAEAAQLKSTLIRHNFCR